MKEVAGLVLDAKDLARCRKEITGSIRDMAAEGSFEGAVLGVSGGVDSAVVLKLACEAKVSVHALIMPEEGVTPASDVEDARAFAEHLGVRYSVVRIDPFLAALKASFPWDDFAAGRKRLSLGNAKARTRMVINYLAANLGNRLVLGTGNRTEILLGYATKYGDGGVDMLPIGDLYKTRVWQLARALEVPERIVSKTPTAGLWLGQTDERELGASYEEIDKLLYLMVEGGKPAAQAAKELSCSEDLADGLLERMRSGAHKRAVPPITKLFDKA